MLGIANRRAKVLKRGLHRICAVPVRHDVVDKMVSDKRDEPSIINMMEMEKSMCKDLELVDTIQLCGGNARYTAIVSLR
ncbi:hypothetical protein BCON_0137g00320 [Botryotinia convoluta]|uniref:Uncharacterized protein n=1 Tax=Botryotinia convoluta TaxID=54673 RepID=A0A4Z1HU39_9HELO|nr:hypothetical protein BCON_0137g00320 [Botryotinia convoluta]